jgi:hypothetical protein
MSDSESYAVTQSATRARAATDITIVVVQPRTVVARPFGLSPTTAGLLLILMIRKTRGGDRKAGLQSPASFSLQPC